MRKLLFGACVAALVAGAANAQQHFTFTDQLETGTGSHLVTGSFDGTLGGDVITGLSNIFVYIDGVGLPGNGALYGSSWGTSGWVSGGAYASLDGTHNDFLFIDSDYPNNTNYTGYFYSVPQIGQDYAWNGVTNQYGYTNSATSNFRAQLAAVPEPASWAMMVGGFGLAGLAMRSRRKATVRIA